MVFRRLDVRVIIFGILSSVTGSLFIWSATHENLRATSAGLLIIWILQVAYLVHLMHKTRREMERFLSAIREKDVSLTFPAGKSDPFTRKLHDRFNELTSNFRLVRKEREQEHQFFMHMIRHVGTGLLAFDQDGTVRISNKALFDLLDIESVTEISRLGKVHPDLPDLLVNLHPGEQYLVKISAASTTRHISVMTSSFKMEEQLITLASFRDISRDLDKTEVEAWQKMIRVVIHEIVSSVVPFRLFSSKLLGYLESEDKNKNQVLLKGDALDDAVSVLNSMNKRSRGLARFAESYKTLSQVPVPDKQVLDVARLFRETELYVSDKLQAATVNLSTRVEPADLKLYADEQLIFQVLVNLVNNAIYAMADADDPRLVLKGHSKQRNVILEVSDNGHGIPEGNLDSVFVPFFTTRKDGSGIGLSLSKQIMNAHNGSIVAISDGGGGTTFQLQFYVGLDYPANSNSSM